MSVFLAFSRYKIITFFFPFSLSILLTNSAGKESDFAAKAQRNKIPIVDSPTLERKRRCRFEFDATVEKEAARNGGL